MQCGKRWKAKSLNQFINHQTKNDGKNLWRNTVIADILSSQSLVLLIPSDDAMKDVAGGENLSYEEYLQVLFNSRNIIRHCFEHCYYSNAWCDFKGGLADLIKRKARSYSIASMYLADLWMVIATKVRKTMSGWILGLLKNIKWEIAYPLEARYIVI